MHTESHPLAGKTVLLSRTAQDPARQILTPGTLYVVEDWWDKLTGKSWTITENNFACTHYAMRSALVMPPLPLDDEVVYGHVAGLGHLVHASELGGVVEFFKDDLPAGWRWATAEEAEDWINLAHVGIVRIVQFGDDQADIAVPMEASDAVG